MIMLQGGGKDEMKQKKCFFLAAWPPVCLATLSSLKKIEPLGLFAGILLHSTLVESMHTVRILCLAENSCWPRLCFLARSFDVDSSMQDIRSPPAPPPPPPPFHLMYFATKTSLVVTSVAGWTSNRIISKNYRRCRKGCHHDIGERGS